ncbi:hypothetical protein [Euzebya tangerina]|uniref:hypothetical protein n=1 Tax=Euzebya tangerina TaxID=591198 RepID=UPI00196AA9FC|nr:hypothetical protein [Euzebya tangerina]
MKDSERYFVSHGRRWRRTDPAIPEALREELVRALMAARRAVKAAKRADDPNALRLARHAVHDAKVALGERGRAWWEPLDAEAARLRGAAALRALARHRRSLAEGPVEEDVRSEELAMIVAQGEDPDAVASIVSRVLDEAGPGAQDGRGHA